MILLLSFPLYIVLTCIALLQLSPVMPTSYSLPPSMDVSPLDLTTNDSLALANWPPIGLGLNCWLSHKT